MMATFSRSVLVEQLRSFGLSEGDGVLVHSSLRAVGKVEGGPTELVRSFLEVLGPSGLLIAPTFSYNASIFDPATEPSLTGGFTEIVRAWPGAVRSLHPTHSVAVLGDNAAEFCQGHELVGAVSAGSPLVRLAEMGGWILLVGVGHNRNTTIHSGECFAPSAYHSVPQPSMTAILRVNGEDRVIPLLERPGCSVGFGAIEGALRKRGAIRDGRLGDSHTQAMRGTDVIETAVELIRADPAALLCSDPTCHRCTTSRALIASAS